jgi:hypothetical protein
MIDTVSSIFAKNKKTDREQHEIVTRLREMGRSSDIANIILAIMVASTAELSLGGLLEPSLSSRFILILPGLVNMVNLYLGSDNDQSIRSLATTSGDLKGYAYEAQSRSSSFSLLSLSDIHQGSTPLSEEFIVRLFFPQDKLQFNRHF